MKRIGLTLIFLSLWFQLQAKKTPVIFEINNRLGRGINMGNAFEPPTETAWNNPWQPEYFKIMADLGFSHVRIPIRWSTPERSMEEPPNTINESFMNRVKQVVDTALKYQLHPIINMHHHEDLFLNPTGGKERFLAQWSQIADFFKDYPDSLVFEVLNEPHNNLIPELWNDFFAEALEVIRVTNPSRAVLLGTALFGGLSGVPYLEIPNDPYIILSVHYYNPFQFTHQGAGWVEADSDEWLGTRWLDTKEERQTIKDEFSFTLEFAEDNNIPVHVGEFGAYYKADIDSRARWTTFLARWFEEQKFSWAYWGFSAGFGIYNPNNGQFNAPLVDALFHNAMPDPAQVWYIPVYEEVFDLGTGGWQLNVFESAQVSMMVNDGELNIDISDAGSEAWHIQLSNQGIAIKKDNLYRISFEAFAENQPRQISSYVGKSTAPWTAYSGYIPLNIDDQENSYIYSFFMNNLEDNNARLVFDLCLSDTNLTFSKIRVEKLSLVPVNIANTNYSIKYYPNPVSYQLTIENANQFQMVSIKNIKGEVIYNCISQNRQNTINTSHLAPGVYILTLGNQSELVTSKFVKK